MKSQKQAKTAEIPDTIPLTEIQANRLSSITGLSAKDLVGIRTADLTDRLQWHIDPTLWRYRRVCGRVVKRDPATGVDYPVPYATVHVEDTDCSVLFYAPPNSQFSWFYPFRCRREEIATTHTDACGRFCVWIPAWEIDWIVRWRAMRICFPIIFQRPSWWDLLKLPKPKPGPFPGPDPGPFHVEPTQVSAMTLAQPGTSAARNVTHTSLSRNFGDLIEGLDDPSEADAFEENLQPPLPEEFVNIVGGEKARSDSKTHELIRGTLAERVGLAPELLADLDLRHVIGPFRRCFTVFLPTWTPIFDVPDVTFRVTQDIDGDGTEEQIYGENYFQVRWDAGSIPDVTLRAAQWARETHVCDAPPVLPCGNAPAINFAGLMPVTAAYHNNATGYAIKPNRPKPGGVSTGPATAPYCLNVNLFGCLPSLPAATKYRLVYRYAPDAGSAFSAPIPLTGVTWYWHPTSAPPVQAVPEAVTGWYRLPPAGLAGTPEESFLFPFDTTRHTPGLYAIKVEMGNAGGNVIAPASPEVTLMCDNRAPAILEQIRWKKASDATWTDLPLDCPVVRRGVAPVDVQFEVRWDVMAPAHYRDSAVGAEGCGASGSAATLTPAGQTIRDWHTGPNDNAMTYLLTYTLPSGNAEGSYSFSCNANSRAFNPSGYDVGYQTSDWLYDIGTPPIYDTRRIYFSVING
jgi:hypothetical protein